MSHLQMSSGKNNVYEKYATYNEEKEAADNFEYYPQPPVKIENVDIDIKDEFNGEVNINLTNGDHIQFKIKEKVSRLGADYDAHILINSKQYEIDLDEETDELKRDIVGHDLYGATRHLFRPTMDFHRYTCYEELTNEERKFINRIGYRSLLNLLNPLLIGKGNFELNESTKFNIGMGYTMSPFGDFIDENIWIRHKNLNIGLYARQFQNRNNLFNGFGISLNDYQLFDVRVKWTV